MSVIQMFMHEASELSQCIEVYSLFSKFPPHEEKGSELTTYFVSTDAMRGTPADKCISSGASPKTA